MSVIICFHLLCWFTVLPLAWRRDCPMCSGPSVIPSTNPSIVHYSSTFLGIDCVFCKVLHKVIGFKNDRAIFFRKINIWPKLFKWRAKWTFPTSFFLEVSLCFFLKFCIRSIKVQIWLKFSAKWLKIVSSDFYMELWRHKNDFGWFCQIVAKGPKITQN